MTSPSRDPGYPVATYEWMMFGAFGLASLSAWDVFTSGDGAGFATVCWAIGLGLFAGALHGATFGGAFFFLKKRAPWTRLFIWLVLGLAAAGWQIDELGIFAKLDGEYRWLAVVGLLASVLGGAAVALLVWLLAPSTRHPRGHLGELVLPLRWTIAALLFSSTFTLMWLDENIQKGGYPSAHLALRVAGLWAFLFGTGILRPRKKDQSKPKSAALVAMWLSPLVALAFVSSTLRSDHQTQLNNLASGRYSALSLRTARFLTDFDLDGYSAFFGGGDCDNFNGRVYPSNQEIPGNGVDDNCSLGDAPLRRVKNPDVVWPQEPSPTSIVLVTIDTVSAPYTSLYGGQKKTTPRLKAWARKAAVFEQAYTSGGWTSLALSSLFRGVYPRRLQWTRLFETNRRRLVLRENREDLEKNEKIKTMFGLPLKDPGMTLPVWLERRGMHTRAVVHDGRSEFLDKQFMSQGFQVYVDLDDPDWRREMTDAQVTEAAIRHLKKLPKNKPFFLWVHYFGPHMGNTRHKGIPDFGSSPADRYRHELAYMDQ